MVQNENIFGMQRAKSLQNSWEKFKNQTVWSEKSSKKKKPHFDHFPRPGEID